MGRWMVREQLRIKKKFRVNKKKYIVEINKFVSLKKMSSVYSKNIEIYKTQNFNQIIHHIIYITYFDLKNVNYIHIKGI